MTTAFNPVMDLDYRAPHFTTLSLRVRVGFSVEQLCGTQQRTAHNSWLVQAMTVMMINV